MRGIISGWEEEGGGEQRCLFLLFLGLRRRRVHFCSPGLDPNFLGRPGTVKTPAFIADTLISYWDEKVSNYTFL